jgi:membrane-bound metal-dependent hydrolase YbcI (DUF457 family)
MQMPVTPLHYVAAYAINKVKLGLVFPALIVGSMMPDLEPFIGFLTGGRLLPPRGFLHSLLGTVTLDTFLTVIITTFVYPTLVVWIFRVERKLVAEKCRFSGMLVLSSLVGTLSHLLIDTTMHEYNPFFYPFTTQSFDTLVLFGHWLPASIFVHTLLFVFLLAIFVYELRKGSEGFWKRLLVE